MIARTLTPVRVFGFAVVAALVWGSPRHLDRYITPDRGLGYALGIIGGSMMLVLLMYPARKRAQWLRFIGGVPGWFAVAHDARLVGTAVDPVSLQFFAWRDQQQCGPVLHADGVAAVG